MVPLMIEDLEAIGIRVNVTRHSATDASAPRAQAAATALIYCANWYADFPDSDNFFYIFFHSDATSIRGLFYHRPEIDAQIIEARRSNDIEHRAAIYRALNQMVDRARRRSCRSSTSACSSCTSRKCAACARRSCRRRCGITMCGWRRSETN